MNLLSKENFVIREKRYIIIIDFLEWKPRKGQSYTDFEKFQIHLIKSRNIIVLTRY